MRTARMKMVGMDAFYHVYNRACGGEHERPFTDVDKEKGFRLVEELATFFLVDVISACWMGNHLHCIVHAPCEAPDAATVAERHNRYWGKRRAALDPEKDAAACAEVGAQMIDISCFMAKLQQRFSCYFNRVHKRRGGLWADRFKSTVLEGDRALWNAVKYIELNPVRAGLTENPRSTGSAHGAGSAAAGGIHSRRLS